MLRIVRTSFGNALVVAVCLAAASRCGGPESFKSGGAGAGGQGRVGHQRRRRHGRVFYGWVFCGWLI